MILNSFPFVLFIIPVFFLYWLVDQKHKWIVLLLSSYVFYAFSSLKYLILLLITTAVSYFLAKLIHDAPKENKSKLLAFGIAVCLIPLFTFKYLDFSIDIVNSLFRKDYHFYNLLLPLGISFYTFEAISFLVDTAKGYGYTLNGHFGHYATYLAFFPTVTSGPIERYNRISEQFEQDKQFNYDEATYGLKLIAYGLFKKIVIADGIAKYITPVFNTVNVVYGFALIVIVVLYPFQIYADFSGYSDMARGIAKLFGIDLSINFDSPYLSTSFKEFWSKWHISLSTWLKDYIYIPLGGNRKGRFRKYLNLIMTFLVSGLWHGANITFVLWGLIHGLLQVLEDVFSIKSVKKQFSIKWFIRFFFFFVLVTLTWIPFRANNVHDLTHIININNILYGISEGFIKYVNTGLDLFLFGKKIIILLLFVLFSYFVDYFVSKGTNVLQLTNRLHPLLRWTIYVVFTLVIIYFSEKGTAEFIYIAF